MRVLFAALPPSACCSARARADARSKNWEAASRPPPPQPTVAQTSARFVGIITLSTPEAAQVRRRRALGTDLTGPQELSHLILQYIRASVDIFYVLKERPEQRGDFLRVSHRMMALIETFPSAWPLLSFASRHLRLGNRLLLHRCHSKRVGSGRSPPSDQDHARCS